MKARALLPCVGYSCKMPVFGRFICVNKSCRNSFCLSVELCCRQCFNVFSGFDSFLKRAAKCKVNLKFLNNFFGGYILKNI